MKESAKKAVAWLSAWIDVNKSDIRQMDLLRDQNEPRAQAERQELVDTNERFEKLIRKYEREDA